jgi:predicted dehydrogenase
MIRAALVGVSGYGRWHLLMLVEQALLGRVKLVAATVINQKQEAALCARLRAHGVEIFADYDAMLAALAGRIDLVLLPTGIHHHAAMTLAALRVGAHVLVEKPLSGSLQEADAIAAAARAAGRVVAVGFQDLYPPLAHEMKRRLLAGEIGRVRRVVVRAHWPRPAAYFTRNGWAGRLRAEGAWVLDSLVNNACAHFLMLALFWAGDTPETAAEPVSVEGTLLRAHPIETFDTASFRLGTLGGPDIEFHGTHCGALDLRPEVRVVGDSGELVWTYQQSCTLRREGLPPLDSPVPDQLSTRLLVLENLLARLRGEPAFIVTPELARAHTRVVNALHAFLPVHPVPPAALDTHEEMAGRFLRLPGIDAALERAAREGRPLAGLGLLGCPSAPDQGEFGAFARFSGPLAPADAALVPAA